MLLNCIVLYRILLFYSLGKTLNHSDQSLTYVLFSNWHMGILSIAMDCKRVMSYPFGGRRAKQNKIQIGKAFYLQKVSVYFGV